MRRYQCRLCEYIYDPVQGDPEGGVPAGTPFDKLPQSWFCPDCGAGVELFDPLED